MRGKVLKSYLQRIALLITRKKEKKIHIKYLKKKKKGKTNKSHYNLPEK